MAFGLKCQTGISRAAWHLSPYQGGPSARRARLFDCAGTPNAASLPTVAQSGTDPPRVPLQDLDCLFTLLKVGTVSLEILTRTPPVLSAASRRPPTLQRCPSSQDHDVRVDQLRSRARSRGEQPVAEFLMLGQVEVRARRGASATFSLTVAFLLLPSMRSSWRKSAVRGGLYACFVFVLPGQTPGQSRKAGCAGSVDQRLDHAEHGPLDGCCREHFAPCPVPVFGAWCYAVVSHRTPDPPDHAPPQLPRARSQLTRTACRGASCCCTSPPRHEANRRA